MQSSKLHSLTRKLKWGMYAVPLAPVEITVAHAPQILALVLVFTGCQYAVRRCYRTGSLLVGASLAVMLVTRTIGF